MSFQYGRYITSCYLIYNPYLAFLFSALFNFLGDGIFELISYFSSLISRMFYLAVYKYLIADNGYCHRQKSGIVELS